MCFGREGWPGALRVGSGGKGKELVGGDAIDKGGVGS